MLRSCRQQEPATSSSALHHHHLAAGACVLASLAFPLALPRVVAGRVRPLRAPAGCCIIAAASKPSWRLGGGSGGGWAVL